MDSTLFCDEARIFAQIQYDHSIYMKYNETFYTYTHVSIELAFNCQKEQA